MPPAFGVIVRAVVFPTALITEIIAFAVVVVIIKLPLILLVPVTLHQTSKVLFFSF